MAELEKHIKQKFIALFETEPLLVYSPGRINLIGEHTDYHEGFVLPAAIDKKIIVAIAANDLKVARLHALDYEENFKFSLEAFAPKPNHWATYIMGVVAQFQQAGHLVEGFDLVFGGDIPVGSGLSSSAALECSAGFAIAQLFGLSIRRLDLVRMAQKAEHQFAGVKCGIMDQYASVMGKKDHAILLDCRSLESTYFPVDLGDQQLLLVNTLVKHSLASSAYNERQLECQEGLIAMQQLHPEIKSLRDANLEVLESVKAQISLKAFRRCQYVLHENQRVLDACQLLEKGDLKGFGQKMYASHQGLSEEYEVSCPELDFLVDFTKENKSVLGSRMMGGGFGGCTINIIERAAVTGFKSAVAKAFEDQFGHQPEFYEVELMDGTGLCLP
ncbi:galactokinase [Pararhodonellum marinum]|uniref:galactokinase n=1 Tax=Pararhodonellum marinum TaxID=2755358 RepID=UPI00188E991E|nr:galactokinase [Pararhodonellum marinum]